MKYEIIYIIETDIEDPHAGSDFILQHGNDIAITHITVKELEE